MEFMAYRAALLAAMVAFATLHREVTGLLIVLSAIAAYRKQWIYWLPSLLTWGFLIIGFRLIYPVENVFSVAHVLEINTTQWRVRNAALYIGLLLPMLILFWQRFRDVPKTTRYNVLIVLIPYMGLWLLFASYQEVRLLMPLFILGIPILATQRTG